MATQHDELERLASHEPVFAGQPDLGAIRRSGRRLRTRRRITTAGASLAVVAGVAGPVAALASLGPDAPAPVRPATSSPSPTDETWRYTFNPIPRLPTDIPDGCGSLFGCPEDAAPETGEVIGEPWAIGGIGDGTVDGMVDEVIYAVRSAPGKPVAVAVGFQDAEGLRRLEVVFRPEPQADRSPVQVVGGVRRLVDGSPEVMMIGLVEDEPVTDVAWRADQGTWLRAPLNDDLVEGFGVFWLVGGWNAEWPADSPAPVVLRVDGQEYVP